MGTLTVTQTRDFSRQLVVNVNSIVFSTSAKATATFSSDQFGGFGISENVAITGDANTNVVKVNLSTNGQTFSAAGWSFSNWDSHDAVEIVGTSGNDTITGSSQRDDIRGGDGADIITGAHGADLLSGGAGDDVFVYNSGLDLPSGEVVNGGIGFDTLRFNASANTQTYDFRSATLDSIEKVDFVGAALTTFSDAQVNALTAIDCHGNLATIVVLDAHTLDLSDITFTNVPSFFRLIRAEGTSGADILTGSSKSDLLNGHEGDDRIDGGKGADGMNGGPGNDEFFVDNPQDFTDEKPGEGIDTAHFQPAFDTGARFSLNPNVEIGIVETSFGLFVVAEGDNNSLLGNVGDDVFEGGGGADFLDGGAGSDTAVYSGSTAGVQVNLSAGIGSGGDAEGDTLVNIENLTGSAFGDVLVGNAGNNRIEGGAGADFIDGSAGEDTASYEVSLSAVQVNLAAATASGGDAQGDVLVNIEDLIGSSFDDFLAAAIAGSTIDGGFGNDIVFGNTGNDVLRGGDGDDQFDGNLGNDVIAGGFGNDALGGNLGSDLFLFDTALDDATNVDTIGDFSVADDTVALDHTIFTGLALGTLAAGNFRIGAAAADADDRIVYDSATGALFFDADGNGAGAAIRFATLSSGLAVTNQDFVVV